MSTPEARPTSTPEAGSAGTPATGPVGTPVAEPGRQRHGAIRLIESACTSCMICARECPSWCITIDSHTEPVRDLPAGARQRTDNVLDRFAIDWSLCMFCGICIDECPFDALEWAADPVAGAQGAAGLVHEIEDLR